MYSFRLKIKTGAAGEKILLVNGDVVGRDTDRFREKLEDCINTTGSEVVVDMKGAGYINSHGLGTLVYKHLKMNEEGKKLVILVEKNSKVEDIFKKTKLNEAMNIRN